MGSLSTATSRSSAKRLSLAPDYSCGEFLTVDSQGARRLMSLACDTFEVSLTRFIKGLPHFNEEGHMLSYLFQRLGFAQGMGAIRRP